MQQCAAMAATWGWAVAATAGIVQAEGVGPITSAGIEQARLAAIRDAQQQLALAHGARVEAATGIATRGRPLESSRVQPAVRFDRISIVREWRSATLLHVVIAARTEEASALPQASGGYRKKVVATLFRLHSPGQVADLRDAASGVPHELVRQLAASGKFLVHENRYALSDRHGPGEEREAIRRIAADNDSQFVISGGIVDASSFTAGGMFGLFDHAVRRFELDLFVHDGMTGALIARHRILETAAGDVRIGGEHPFGSAAFTANSYGQAIARALASAASLIAADLEHLPFMARIIEVSGKRVYIDAGGTSLLAPGDQLVVFHRGPALHGDGAASFGPAETPVATLSITEVQPTFAAAEVDPSAVAPAIASGDLVRFEFASERQAVQVNAPQLF